MDFEQKINDEFCQEMGIKKYTCFIENKDTGERKFYINPSGYYKSPKGWNNIQRHKIEPRYPDLINNPRNFLKLLNIQWRLFGSLADIYNRTGDENFELNYVKTRLKACRMCRSLGGGDGLDVYREEILKTKFEV